MKSRYSTNARWLPQTEIDSRLRLPCLLLNWTPSGASEAYLRQIHSGNGTSQVSPTFPPHWWKERIGTHFRPAAAM